MKRECNNKNKRKERVFNVCSSVLKVGDLEMMRGRLEDNGENK